MLRGGGSRSVSGLQMGSASRLTSWIDPIAAVGSFTVLSPSISAPFMFADPVRTSYNSTLLELRQSVSI